MTHPTFDSATFTLAVPGTDLTLRPGKENQIVGEVEAWIHSVQAGFNKNSLLLVIVDSSGKVIGEGPLGSINWDTKEAESGVMLDHQQAGKGVATKVLNASMDFAFRELGLEKVKYGTMQDNKAMSKVLMDKLKVKGKPEEGTMKDGNKEYNFVFTKQDWLAASS
ncbi:hypothetical protein [Sporisorium scitamineum]|uniref:N-acetyltransferase domain-containing protein n=1 Tax=Sporisorium scitamineum TaxID=49012 RepID=A0A0F7SBC6_9BASI|nr:hypothetical protein [Sporisorium scitamineum]